MFCLSHASVHLHALAHLSAFGGLLRQNGTHGVLQTGQLLHKAKHDWRADAGKSVKSMARGGQGLPREMGGDPLDLLDAGTSRKMVKHAAARATAAAGPAPEEEDEFEHADNGKMIIRVCGLPCGDC